MDIVEQARRLRPVREAVQNARVVLVDYRNPDALNDAKQPNYCSTETIFRFRYSGPAALLDRQG